MNNRQKVEFYDKYLEKELSHDKPTYDDVLSELIRYHNVRNAGKSKEDFEIEKMGFITEILPSFANAKTKASIDVLLSLCNYIKKAYSFPSYYLSALLDFSFNPQDIFKFEDRSIDANINFDFYSRIVDYLLLIESYHMDEEIPKIKPIIYAHEALLILRSDMYANHVTNSFLPNIIVYCIWKGYDIDKLRNMVTYSYDHMEDIYAYLELNQKDEIHNYELIISIMEKISENNDNIREIR